jgi:uncharacterized protein (TIGR01777 family)
MKVLITGVSGFVGTHTAERLLEEGDHVVGTGTRSSHDRIRHENFRYICADTSRQGEWQEEIRNADAVVNLAGKNIFNRWTRRYKREIYESRIQTTRRLVEALPETGAPMLCSASAVGYYGDRGDETLTEDATAGDDFLAGVGKDWEAEAFAAKGRGSRVVAARFGIVLGKDGGALAKMLPAFKSFVGGPLGDGNQWFPWIHVEDLVSALRFALRSETVQGPINICAPNPVRNRELARTLGEVLGRPAVVPVPKLMVRMALGEAADPLTASIRAVPEALVAAGFSFRFEKLEDALRDLVDA